MNKINNIDYNSFKELLKKENYKKFFFKDLEDDRLITVWEVKALIEIYFNRLLNNLKKHNKNK